MCVTRKQLQIGLLCWGAWRAGQRLVHRMKLEFTGLIKVNVVPARETWTPQKLTGLLLEHKKCSRFCPSSEALKWTTFTWLDCYHREILHNSYSTSWDGFPDGSYREEAFKLREYSRTRQVRIAWGAKPNLVATNLFQLGTSIARN